jgi:hypothetical protein
MATENETKPDQPEPRGFGEHTRGLSGEYAHEQGWGLDVEERTRMPQGKQDISGGKDYDYSARDFGDEPTNMERAATAAGADEEETARRALGVDDRLNTTEEK